MFKRVESLMYGIQYIVLSCKYAIKVFIGTVSRSIFLYLVAQAGELQIASAKGKKKGKEL